MDFIKELKHHSCPKPQYTLALSPGSVSKAGLRAHNVDLSFSPHLSQAFRGLGAPFHTPHTPSPRSDAQFWPREADHKLTGTRHPLQYHSPPPTSPTAATHPLHAPLTLPSGALRMPGPLTRRRRAVSSAASRPEHPRNHRGPGPRPAAVAAALPQPSPIALDRRRRPRVARARGAAAAAARCGSG